ncbi:MAG: TonB family protein, partial [Sandaracinaceae bacterium]
GQGILRGRGDRPARAARVAHGRPRVDRGRAATPAATRERPRDNADAELLATAMMQSWVDATPRTATRVGTGRGGVDRAGAPGSGGGQGEGGRATAHRPGPGDDPALDTSDRRYRRWFLEQGRRIRQALVFPRERLLAMDQGTSLFTIDVRRDGTLIGRPRLKRSSGFADFDRAAATAIREVSPFAPFPADVAPGLAVVRLEVPVEFSNPMVR